MGVSAVVFNHVFRFPGADPAVPLYGFIFLVALGVDYNIFLMTRVREESLGHGTREGVIRGLMITGSVITSAGIVLAATFAALGVIPVLFLAQLAFIVAFGVLLDTLVVRSLLVPALSYDIGRRIWWPSRLARNPLEPEPGLHFRGGGVGGGGTIREDHGGHGLVASVQGFNQLSGAFDVFDVDLRVADSLAVQLRLQTAAVSAPGGGKHGDGSRFGGEGFCGGGHGRAPLLSVGMVACFNGIGCRGIPAGRLRACADDT